METDFIFGIEMRSVEEGEKQKCWEILEAELWVDEWFFTQSYGARLLSKKMELQEILVQLLSTDITLDIQKMSLQAP